MTRAELEAELALVDARLERLYLVHEDEDLTEALTALGRLREDLAGALRAVAAREAATTIHQRMKEVRQ